MSSTASTAEAQPKFPGIQKFIFDTPLYDMFEGTPGDGSGALGFGATKVEGHCPMCRTSRVFVRTRGPNYSEALQSFAAVENGIHRIDFDCSMNAAHTVTLFIMVSGKKFGKVGQFPSVADIANDASKIYSKILEPDDRRELSRAVGLASHGIGIGSFVYMRRVFERLVTRRAVEAGLPPADFARMRMSEKIEALKDHLPRFLVEHKAVYGILSLGIHQLTEDQCLAFYQVLHESILTILEDDRRRKEDEQRRSELSAAIKKMQSIAAQPEES